MSKEEKHKRALGKEALEPEAHICSWCDAEDDDAVLLRNKLSGLMAWACRNCYRNDVPNMSKTSRQNYLKKLRGEL